MCHDGRTAGRVDLPATPQHDGEHVGDSCGFGKRTGGAPGIFGFLEEGSLGKLDIRGRRDEWDRLLFRLDGLYARDDRQLDS